MQIQWGFSASNGASYLPISFSNTNYIISANMYAASGTYYYCQIDKISTSSFNIWDGLSGNHQAGWIAVGH